MAGVEIVRNRPVFFDHDGGTDDLLALLLLLAMENVELLGIGITPADCYIGPATEATLKILAMRGVRNVPVARGSLHGVNAFPREWRARPKMINALPAMLATPLDLRLLSDKPADVLLAETVAAADRPVTVLLTGPCSNLVAAVQKAPHIVANIGEVLWMAGAVDVGGNVLEHNHDGSAEWNVHWDPPASAQLLALGLNIRIVPLDATDSVPVGIDFLKRLAAQREHPVSDFAGQCWATTVDTFPNSKYTYYMWDVLTAACLGLPHGVVEFDRAEIKVLCDEPSSGRTVRSPGCGQFVEFAKKVAAGAFHDYLLARFRC